MFEQLWNLYRGPGIQIYTYDNIIIVLHDFVIVLTPLSWVYLEKMLAEQGGMTTTRLGTWLNIFE